MKEFITYSKISYKFHSGAKFFSIQESSVERAWLPLPQQGHCLE